MHCSCTGVCQIRPNPDRNLAAAEFGRIWGKWPDFGFTGAEIWCDPRIHVVWANLRQNRLDGLTSRRVPEQKSESYRDSHRKDMSPLTQGLNYRSACDWITYTHALSGFLCAAFVNTSGVFRISERGQSPPISPLPSHFSLSLPSPPCPHFPLLHLEVGPLKSS